MSKVTMPEPVAVVVSDFAIFWAVTGPVAPLIERNGVRVGSLLITTDQAEAYATAKVREALEEAAQACEARIGTHAPGMTPEDVEDCDEEARLCAGAVRSLIPKE
ncbi:hypothetical protein [Kerstersia similis]|uniref:hypothetical protein n=1 Tax=Kerstersia similis TaxID=206505 RepID=UPI0039F0600B